MIRIGQGIDVHAFYDKSEESDGYDSESSQFVTLAGVQIEHSHSLLAHSDGCLLYTSPSPRDATLSRMPSSA